MIEIGYLAAAVAGLLSFLSPCVLPLVPPYLCYLAGASVEELSEARDAAARRRILLAALLFVAGFTTVFVALGATASLAGQFMRAHLGTLSWAAGLVIIAMGLHFLGVFRIGLLFREKRIEAARPAGPFGAYVMGLAFAFGWTPCIGPILAGILAIAGSEETIWKGASLLAVYSMGLGLPFVLAAVGIQAASGAIARFKPHFRKVEMAMGGLLVLTGVAFLTGWMSQAAFWLLETFPALARLG